jgi:hypothetical protein
MGTFCERNLTRSASEGFEEVNSEIQRIEILNESDFPKNIKLKVIDYHHFIGAFIDRALNADRQVIPFIGPMLSKRGKLNLDVYMPNIKAMWEPLSLNFEILLRVETNLKLNLIFTNGKCSVTDPNEDEVHFIRLESVCFASELRFSSILKILGEAFNMEKN